MTLADDFGDLMTDTVELQTKTGRGSAGDILASPVPVANVMVMQARKLVRDSSGDLTTSTLQILVEPDRARAFTLGSLVVFDNRRPAAVLQVAVDTHVMDAAVVSCE